MQKFDLSLWLQNKSRKVITRDGREIEIVKYDMKGTHFPVLYVISNEDGSQEPCECSKSGMCQFDNIQSSTDLFFADEKDDLTEFEKELEMMMVSFSNGNLGSDVRKEMPKQKLHNCAHRLLDLARKKLEKSIEDGAIEFAKSYMEDVNPSFEKVQESEELWKWKMSCLRGVNKAYTNGKQDALKDLPKWKKTKDTIDPTIPVMYTLAASMKSYVEYNGYKVCINELFETLPKEE